MADIQAMPELIPWQHEAPRWWAEATDLIESWDRPDGRELLWICMNCRQHYMRTEQPPTRCTNCGAGATYFYAAIED